MSDITFILETTYNEQDYQEFKHGLKRRGFTSNTTQLTKRTAENYFCRKLSWVNRFRELNDWMEDLQENVTGNVVIPRNNPIISAAEAKLNRPVVGVVGGAKVPRLHYYDPNDSHIRNIQQVTRYSDYATRGSYLYHFIDYEKKHLLQYPLMIWWHRRMKQALSNIDAVVVNSQYMKQLHQEAFNVSPDVVYPPIDPEKYKVEYNPSGEIGIVSPRHRKKGDDIFVEIAKAMPDQQFRVCGIVSERIEDEVTSQENIVVDGWCDDMREFYCKISSLLVPSRYEAFGRIAAEALVSGIPPVVANTGGLPEVVGDDKLVVNEIKNVEEWRETIRSARMMGKRPDLQERTINKYNAQSQLDRMESIIEGVLAE